MMQLDGTPVPRLPDSVPGLPVEDRSRPSYHEALRTAHQVHAHTMARGKHRHGGTGSAVVSGVLLMALLAGGVFAVNRYIWNESEGADAGRFEVETAVFGGSLPVLPVELAQPEVTLGAAVRVTTWTAQTDAIRITIVAFDMDMVAPGAAEDPARVDAMRQSGHDAVVQRENVGALAASATKVDGRVALVSSATIAGGRAMTVTSVLHRSSLVAVVCTSSTAAMPPECAAAIDSIDLH